MTSENWSRVDQLYHEALVLPHPERIAFLRQACSADEELFRRVEALLGAHEQAGEFLITPALEVAARKVASMRTAVQVGMRLGSHEILSLLGEGGMGRVFRARDTKLKRDVAIKVLPDEFARDAQRLARFQREAELLASLNYPSIATIHDIQEFEGTRFLVLELVEGETLADRLKRGSIPWEEALPLAHQIAEALEAAHSKDIVHRDLKPANIKVTPEGKVKVLDFGLAKAVMKQEIDGRASDRPTRNIMESREGVILGTAPYMSPEQARGESVDRMSDNWAFGCIVYEMLCGSRAFAGNTITDILSNIVRAEPEWTGLPSEIPLPLRLLLKRCLQKDRRRRLQHIGDARIEIEQLLTDPALAPVVAETPNPPAAKPRALWTAVAVAALALVTSLAGIFYFRSPAAPGREVQFEIPLPPSTGPARMAISPDGSRLAYRKTASGGDDVAIWVRSLNSLSAQMLPGTEGVTRFSWSPDSKSLVFCAAPKAQFESAKIKTINLAGGAVRTLAADAGQFSMNQPAWSREGVILYTSGGNHRLRRVSALGGEPADATEPDSAQGETAHLWPWFLPDGRHFLYLSRKPGNSAIYIASLDSKARTSLMASNVRAVYAAPGFILFLRQQTLMAQPFDAKRLRFTGEAPQVVAENIFRNDTTGYAAFDASDDGTLIYLIRDEPATPSSHVWKDRSGKTIGPASITMRAGVGNWTLSPDDKRVAWGDEGDLFVYEFARAQLNRLTTDGTQDEVPVWSPDGSRLVFARTENKDSALYERVADGAVPERRMLAPESAVSVTPLDWSRDGQRIVFSKQLAGSGRDLWVLPLSGDQKSFPYLKTPGDKYSAAISPDGRFLAYVSNEQKKYEVFVQTFPDPKGGKWRISPNGGWAPRWRRDGRELFYLTLDGHLVAVSVNTEPRFEPGQSITLAMSLAFNPGAMGARAFPYDVSADGKRFLVREPASATGDNSTTSPLRVILNWTASLKH